MVVGDPLHNVRPISGRVDAAPDRRTRSIIAGSVHWMGGLCRSRAAAPRYDAYQITTNDPDRDANDHTKRARHPTTQHHGNSIAGAIEHRVIARRPWWWMEQFVFYRNVHGVIQHRPARDYRRNHQGDANPPPSPEKEHRDEG